MNSAAKPLQELIRYRDLLLMLTQRDIRIRYKQSVMGFLWALLMPTLIVGAGVLIRYIFSIQSNRSLALQDVASVTLKAIPWAFFVGAIRFATTSLTSNSNLVTKIYFPREVFPLSAIFVNLSDSAVASGVVIPILALTGIGVSVHLLWVPIILLLMIIFTSALALFLSCANLFFRDVKYIVEVLLTFGVLFTPVFYEARMLGKWEPFVLLNPIAVLLESLNDAVVLHRPPNPFWLTYAASVALMGFLVSWKIFKMAEASFAENI